MPVKEVKHITACSMSENVHTCRHCTPATKRIFGGESCDHNDRLWTDVSVSQPHSPFQLGYKLRTTENCSNETGSLQGLRADVPCTMSVACAVALSSSVLARQV